MARKIVLLLRGFVNISGEFSLYEPHLKTTAPRKTLLGTWRKVGQKKVLEGWVHIEIADAVPGS